MRIVNAMLGRGLGGIEQAFLDYHQALTHSGHEVRALIHPRALVRREVEKRCMNFLTLANLGGWDPWAAFRLRKMLRRFRPDACIAHGNRARALLLKAGTRPIIGVAHNYKLGCRGLDAIFCPTPDLSAYARAQGVPEDRLFDVPNAVRVPKIFAPRARRSPPVIGAMGRFVAKKGFDIFLAALTSLSARGISYRAVLAGSGAEEETLKRVAKEKALPVEFPGWVEDKAAFFARLDVFCLPSIHEPFGIALVEAMASGVPVVAAASEGPSRILEATVNGLLVPPGDASALAQAITLLLADEDLATRLARAGHAKARECYDLPVLSAKLDLALARIRPV